MQWTRPTWPIAFDLIAYGAVLLGIVIVAGLWRLLGW
jgi:hypothetical protein